MQDIRDKNHRRNRIAAIAEEIVANRLQKKELDESDVEAMEKACKEAVKLAAEAYDAAVEFMCG